MWKMEKTGRMGAREMWRAGRGEEGGVEIRSVVCVKSEAHRERHKGSSAATEANKGQFRQPPATANAHGQRSTFAREVV